MKSLVFDWLSGTDAKIAKKFQKEVGAVALTPDSPKLKDIVAQYSASPAGKRKAEPATNGSAKKAKKVSRQRLARPKVARPLARPDWPVECRVLAQTGGDVVSKLAQGQWPSDPGPSPSSCLPPLDPPNPCFLRISPALTPTPRMKLPRRRRFPRNPR